jgi:mono/diheme cytochrome c family protein
MRVMKVMSVVIAFLLANGMLAAANQAQVQSQQTAQLHHRNDDLWQPGWMQRRMWSDHDIRARLHPRMQRHWTYMHLGIPETYRDARPDVSPTTKTLADGRALYGAKCASCHGKMGMGDGDAGKALSPSPALLSYLIQRPMAVDEYLLWTIAEGGKQFGADMPAFKGTLSRTDIWKIIAYMRWGFPVNGPSGPK